MRIAVEHAGQARAGAEADLVEHLHDQRIALGAAELGAMQRQAFGDDAADRHARAERAERILEDDLDAAPHGAQHRAVGAVDARAVERHRAGGDRLQREQGQAERRLARPRFADDAERLAAAQAERRAPHGVEAAPPEAAVRDLEADANLARVDEHRRVRVDRRDGAPRPAGEQRLRVAVLRRSEHRRGRPGLDQLAALHDADAVREAAHQVEVVGDEEERHPHLAPAARRAGRGSAPGSSRRGRSSARRR